MTKRKTNRAPFSMRWAFLQDALDYLWTGKLPRPKRKAKKVKKVIRKSVVKATPKPRKPRVIKSITETNLGL